MSFIPDLTLPQLGAGAVHAVWAVRAAAVGGLDCPALARAYSVAFGDDRDDALAGVLVFTRAIGLAARKRVGLAAPGCCGVTRDELSIVNILAAAQAGDDDALDARLAWFAQPRYAAAARAAARTLATAFSDASLPFETVTDAGAPGAAAAAPRAVRTATASGSVMMFPEGGGGARGRAGARAELRVTQ
ncbi:MAG: hypothetical protein AAGC56_08945 [Pseudomonadota bacterium]